MSKRKPYWQYVKAVIREYPALKKELETPLEVRVTPVYDAVGGRGSMVSDPTANAVIHSLPRNKMRKLEAVENAIQDTRVRHDNWKLRLDLIDLVYWRRYYTLSGAATKLYIHMNTAGKYQADFIKSVAMYLDIPEDIAL